MKKRQFEIVAALIALLGTEGLTAANAEYTRAIDGMVSPVFMCGGSRNKSKYQELVDQGNQFFDKSDYRNAGRCYDAALQISGDWGGPVGGFDRFVMYRAGICLKQNGQYSQAATYFAKLPNTDLRAQYNLAFCYWKSKRFDKAKKIVDSNLAKSSKEVDFTALKQQINAQK